MKTRTNSAAQRAKRALNVFLFSSIGLIFSPLQRLRKPPALTWMSPFDIQFLFSDR